MPTPKPRRSAAVQRERQRIAQALHDTFCQELTGIGLLVNATAYRCRTLHPETEQQLKEVAELIQRTNANLSKLVRDLQSRSEAVDDGG